MKWSNNPRRDAFEVFVRQKYPEVSLTLNFSIRGVGLTSRYRNDTTLKMFETWCAALGANPSPDIHRDNRQADISYEDGYKNLLFAVQLIADGAVVDAQKFAKSALELDWPQPLSGIKRSVRATRTNALRDAVAVIEAIDDGEAPEYRACQEAIRAMINRE